MKIRLIMVSALASVATAVAFAQPAQAAPAPERAEAQITLGGERFAVASLKRALPYVGTDAQGKVTLRPGLRGKDLATAQQYAELVKKVTVAVETGNIQAPDKKCAKKFWARWRPPTSVMVFLPACALPSLGVFAGFAAAIAAAAGALDEVSEKVAKIIGAVIVAAGAAVLAAWEFCKLFFSDKGMFAVVNPFSPGPLKVYPECASD